MSHDISEVRAEPQSAASPASHVRFRATGFNPKANPVAAWGFFVAVIALWQLGSSTGVISELAMPSPVAVAKALWQLIVTGDLWLHLGASLQRLVGGWIMGTVAGLFVGFLVGMFSWARSPGVAFVSALFPIPKIALLPLFIIWFGIGEPSKFATIAFGVFFPTVINTFGGVDNVQRNLIRMGQSFDLPMWSVIRKIILPGALPTILSGFRISSSIAIILLIAAEMIGAQYGIGALILAAGNLYQTDQLIAGVVVLSLLGLCVSWLLGRLDRWLLAWR
ncbi:MAG: ABC transporter permease [Thalassospira sp.]|uniref:ABC transporter permease n=1 Tax=Thalassospira sp. MCCC 1A03138 TaxID=1470576 RepID=UPI00111C6318|nr:ABC transporter permease [Thalassospira sp. MCCC 1A03138]MBL4841240.1 ABC transporter permease [Thalassospira sp.]